MRAEGTEGKREHEDKEKTSLPRGTHNISTDIMNYYGLIACPFSFLNMKYARKSKTIQQTESLEHENKQTKVDSHL